METGLEFIYDRTQEDVDRVKELYQIGWQNMTDAQKNEWAGNMKGSLNVSDLQRIENNIDRIARLLEIDSVQTNKDHIPELPDTEYFAGMLKNLEELNEAGYGYMSTPDIPNLPVNTYEKVNAIEKILHDIYENYIANLESRVYCGEVYAGEIYGLL